jgi:ferredoxin
MIIANVKPFDEIVEMIQEFDRVLNVGCAGCTAVCLTGGQKEVDLLIGDLNRFFKKNGAKTRVEGYTVERQCEPGFLSELDALEPKVDAMLSMGCGAGVQLIAERFPDKPIFPALNTLFVGVNRDVGWYEENCRSCGDCQLAFTGGICPVTRCAKSLFNGPCGGSMGPNGCEIDGDTACAWYDIIERLKRQGRLDQIEKVRMPVAWQSQGRGMLVLDSYRG